MRKMLIFGIAISLVLVSGGLFSAQAGCFSWLSPCNWHSPCAGASHDEAAAAAKEEVATSSCSPCNWHFPSLCNLNLNPCGWHFPSCGSSSRDADAASKDAYPPTALRWMGSPAF